MSKDTPLGISFENKPKEDVTRGATRSGQTMIHGPMGGHMDAFAAPQSRQKGAASASRMDTDMPFEITLALEPQGTKSSVPQIVVMDAAESKSDPISMDWVNDLSSHEVKGQSPEQVLNRLTSVLLQYSPELDMAVNEKEQCIDCVLFTESSFEALRFKLGVFEHFGSTRFELLRHDGAALSMAKLEGDLKALFFSKDGGDVDPEDEEKGGDDPFSFIAMDLDVSGMPPLPNLGMAGMTAPSGISQDDLDEICQSLMGNARHCVDELYDLHCDLTENISMAQDITDHGRLVTTLIDVASKHEDIAVVRACVLMLDALCNDKEAAMLLMTQNAIYKQLSAMLSGKSILVRNYVVRLLATLSSLKWNMDSDLAKTVESEVKGYHAEWKKSLSAQSGLIEEKTFTAIYNKLAQFN